MNEKINIKNNLKSNIEKEMNSINMKKEYEEYKNFIIKERKENSQKLSESDIEKKWLESKMPLLKRQFAFNI